MFLVLYGSWFSLGVQSSDVPPSSGQVLAKPVIPVEEMPWGSIKILPDGSETEGPIALSPDLQSIKERGYLIVAMYRGDVSPFMQVDSEQTPCTEQHLRIRAGRRILCGLEVQNAVAIAKALEVDLKFDRTATTFDGVVELVAKHEADIALSKLSRTLPRATKVLYTKPYIIMRQGLLVSRKQLAQQTSNPTEFIRNLTGKVGVIQGTSYAKWLGEKFPNATLAEFPRWEEAIAALQREEIIGAYRDELEVKKIIKTQPKVALNLQTVALDDTRDALAMITATDSPHLLAFLNQYIEDQSGTLTVDTLLDNYEDLLGVPPKPQP